MKAFRLMLARKLFETGLWKLGGLVLRERGVLFLEDGTLVFRINGRTVTREGTRVE